MPTTRRTFLTAATASVALPAAVTPAAAAMLRRIDGGVPDSFPAADPDVAFEIVAKAHFDADACRTICEKRPELAKASIDLGFGDWESGLGAASHMGRRDIAEIFIRHGARPNLFTFAMLGQVDAVRAVCEANPGIQRIRGPHGITLLDHARYGKEQARSVVDYLEELGDADIKEVSKPITSEVTDAYVGEYEPRGAPDVTFHIRKEPGGTVTFGRDDRQIQFLNYHGDHAFAPSGAPAVRITFQAQDGRATMLTIRDGDLSITARRQ
jgi:hypothetical protein